MRVNTMRSIPMLLALLAVTAMTGCQSSDEWRWDWWNKEPNSAKRRPVKQSQPTPSNSNAARAERSPTGADAPIQDSTDPRSREVDDKVRRYVESMNQDTEGDGAYNDFNSKIARQQDPNRHRRIRDGAESAQRDEQRVASAQPVSRRQSPRDGGIHDEQLQEPVARTRSTPTRVQQEPIRSADSDTDPPSHMAEYRRDSGQAQKPEVEKIASPEVTPAAFTGSDSPASEDARPNPTPMEQPPTRHEPADPVVRTNVHAKAPRKTEQVTEDTQQDTRQGSGRDAREETDATPPPPVVDEIKITPVSESPDASFPAVKTSGSSTAPVAPPKPVDTFAQRLKRQEALVAQDPNNLAEQYRLRMWYLIDGQDDKALALSDDVDADKQEILQAQIRALMAARVVTGRDPAIGANQLLEPIENLHNIIRARADLQVSRVALCRAVDAFGLYDPIDPAEFPAGRTVDVLLYIEVDNYRSDKMPSGFYRTLLTVRPSLLNKAGDELWNAKYENIEDLSRRQRRDFFLTIPEKIPASLSPGEYVLKVEVEDVLAGKINSNVAKFKLVVP